MTTLGAQPGASARGGGLRIGDAERDRAVAMLQDAYAEGRIDHAELDRRIGSVLAARERGELSSALRGLPTAGGAFVPLADPGAGRPGRSGAGHPATSWVGSTALDARPESLERSWAFVAHWIGFVTLFVGPMIIAVTKGKSSRFVREQAWEAANFHLTFIGANILLGIVTAVTFGLAGFLFAPLALAWCALTGIAGLASAAGNHFRYPWSLRIFG